MLSYSVNQTRRAEEAPRMFIPNARSIPVMEASEPETELATKSTEESVESTDESSVSSGDDLEATLWRGRRQVDLAAAELPKSDRPLELGVVHTSAGTVVPGIVLAGIVTGRYPETAKARDKLNLLHEWANI